MKLFNNLLGKSKGPGYVLGSAPPPPPVAPPSPGHTYDCTFTESDEVLGLALERDRQDGRAVVVEVTGAAQEKGIVVGDKVVAVDGNVIEAYDDLIAILHSLGRPLVMRFECATRTTVTRSSPSPPPPPSRGRMLSEDEQEARRLERARAAESRTSSWDKKIHATRSQKLVEKQQAREVAALQKARFDQTESAPELMEQIKRMELQTVAELGYNPYQSQMASNHVAKAAIEKTAPGALSSSAASSTSTSSPFPMPPMGMMGGDSLDRSNASIGSTRTVTPIPDHVLQDPNRTPELELAVQYQLDTSIAVFLDQPREVWTTALSTMHKMVSNLLRDSHNVKYRRIRLSNPTFQSKVGSVPGALEILLAGGFELDAEGEDAYLCAPGGPPYVPPAMKILYERLDQIVAQSTLYQS